MGRAIEIFCHVVGVTDPLAVNVATGIVVGGVFLFGLWLLMGLIWVLLMKFDEITSR